jgi:hypothetical protein
MPLNPTINDVDPMHELSVLTGRECVMAKLARKIAWGKDAIFHGTRYAKETLRTGKLIPPDWGDRAICLTRSPETAAYFALVLGREVDQWSGAILVLNRGSLCQRYRLEPHRYDGDEEDDKDEREERIFGRPICFRRHLIGVVREADVTKVLGPPKYKYTPPDFLIGRTLIGRPLTGRNVKRGRDSFGKVETRCEKK